MSVAVSTDPDRIGFDPARLARIDEHFGRYVDDGRLAGFIGLEQRLMIESGDKAEVVGLVVDAVARRTGTGRRLIAAAEDWACARGLGELFLRSNVVRPEAHAFYPALGFERSKTQHVYRKALA